MKNPFTAKLRGQLAAAERERDNARAERDAHATKLSQVEPTIEQRAQDLAIDLIASAGVRAPIPAGEGALGSKTAPRSRQEFLDAYNRIGDAEDAAVYFETHKAILND